MSFVIALFAGTVVTASAAESDLSNNGWYDALDYGTLIDSNGNPVDNSYFELNGYYPFGVDLPTENTLYATDILLSIDGNVNVNQMEVQFVWQTSGAYANLEIYHIGNNLYRVYGDVPAGNYTSFDIRFWNHDGNTYKINVLSLNVSIAEITFFRDIGSVRLISNSGESTATMANINSNAALVQYSSSPTPYIGTVYFDNWRKYDYVDFIIHISSDTIISLGAADTYGNIIPFTVSYLSDDVDGQMSFMRIRLDLTGMDKTEDVTSVYYPYIEITGEASGSFYFTLRSVVGHVVVPAPDTEVFWWTKLLNSIDSWFSNLGSWLSSGFQSIVDKLDMLITGGAAGDALQQGSDQLKEDAGNLKEDIGAVEDFENEQFGALDENMGDVVQGANIGMLATPLLFIQSYLNKIVQGIPSTYLIVFTLPLFFGLFLYIVQHPVRSPRPDTSGDIVTRETFTETTILSGPRAGKSTSTRTVTTSHEIGRVHDP